MRRRRVFVAGIVVRGRGGDVRGVGFGWRRQRRSLPWEAVPRLRLRTRRLSSRSTRTLSSPSGRRSTACSRKFPGCDTLVGKLQKRFEQKTGLSWTNDVLPALGPEVDVAVLPTASGGKPDAVLLTQPSDPAKLTALLQKASTSDGPAPVVAHGRRLDGGRRQPGGARRGDRGDVASRGRSRLPGRDRPARAGRACHAYANGAQARQLLSALGHADTGSGKVVWAAGDAVATSGGAEAGRIPPSRRRPRRRRTARLSSTGSPPAHSP